MWEVICKYINKKDFENAVASSSSRLETLIGGDFNVGKYYRKNGVGGTFGTLHDTMLHFLFLLKRRAKWEKIGNFYVSPPMYDLGKIKQRFAIDSRHLHILVLDFGWGNLIVNAYQSEIGVTWYGNLLEILRKERYKFPRLEDLCLTPAYNTAITMMLHCCKPENEEKIENYIPKRFLLKIFTRAVMLHYLENHDRDDAWKMFTRQLCGKLRTDKALDVCTKYLADA